MLQARRDSNPQPPDLESGALAVRATGLFDSPSAHSTDSEAKQSLHAHFPFPHTGLRRSLPLLGFLMGGVLSTKPAILFKFQALSGLFFIFGRRIILALAVTASQLNNISHNPKPSFKVPKPSSLETISKKNHPVRANFFSIKSPRSELNR